MSDLPNRTIADLVARYTLEPTLRDIIVEGQFDKEVISRALNESRDYDRIVYTINSVNVPNDIVIKHGLSDGNKQRVIVLARELASLPAECAYRCLVDKDLDHWFGPLETTARLLWTNPASLELYFFTDAILKDIILTTAQCRIDHWDEFLDSMVTALRDLYLLRLADRELSWNLAWLTPDRCMKFQSGCVSLDLHTLIERILLSNCRGDQKSKFESTIDRWRKKVAGDCRQYIHGHDFVQMLVWVISKRGRKEFATEDAISRILVLIASRAESLVSSLS